MNIEIIARRWRDTYGNTYHTVEIRRSYPSTAKHTSPNYSSADDRPSILSDIAYGYESAWEETALDVLCPLYGGRDDRGIWHWANAFEGVTVEHTVIDVKRKRDLLPHTNLFRQSRSSNYPTSHNHNHHQRTGGSDHATHSQPSIRNTC